MNPSMLRKQEHVGNRNGLLVGFLMACSVNDYCEEFYTFHIRNTTFYITVRAFHLKLFWVTNQCSYSGYISGIFRKKYCPSPEELQSALDCISLMSSKSSVWGRFLICIDVQKQQLQQSCLITIYLVRSESLCSFIKSKPRHPQHCFYERMENLPLNLAV